jgi:hypothetical protein
MIMTADQSTADVTINYTNYDGTPVSVTKSANPAVSIDQRYDPALTMNLFFGSATITSAKPIVALANLVTTFSQSRGVRASTYRAFADGSGTLNVFVPQVLKNYLDSGTNITWGTGMVVRLLGNSAGTVTVTYYNNVNSAVRTNSYPISPSSPLVNIDQRYDSSLSDQSVVNGSAVVTSTVPIAATVNEVGSSATVGDETTTYAGVNQ